MLERDNAEVCLHVFGIAHARDGARVGTRDLGDILQNHRLQVAVVAHEEIVFLEKRNCAHGVEQRLVSLPDGIDEVATRFEFLFQKSYGFFFGFGVLVFLQLSEHVLIVARETDRRHVVVSQRYENLAIYDLHSEVGGDMIASVFVDIVGERRAGVRAAVGDDFVGLLKRFFGEVIALAKAVEMMFL